MVYLSLTFFRGLLTKVIEHTVVEDDVFGESLLDFAISTLAALHIFTEQLLVDAHLTTSVVDECPKMGEF